MSNQPTGKYQKDDRLWTPVAHITHTNLPSGLVQEYGQCGEIPVVIQRQVGSQEYEIILPTGAIGRTTTRRLHITAPNERAGASQPPAVVQNKDKEVLVQTKKKRGRPAKEKRVGPPVSDDDVRVDDWRTTDISIDQRLLATGGQEYISEPLYHNNLDDMFQDFMQFFPLSSFAELFPRWEQLWRQKHGDYDFVITQHKFVQFLGIVMVLAVYNQNIQDGFSQHELQLNLKSFMSEQSFRRLKNVMTYPVLQGAQSRANQAKFRSKAAPTQQQEPAPSGTSPPPDNSAPTPAPPSDLRTRGKRQAGAPSGAPSGPPDPNPGQAAEAEDDASSEASSNESNPADQMAELETMTKEELLAEEFICEYLSEGYDIVVDMTEIFCRKWRSAFKPGSCIVIDETMIGWQGVHSGRLQFIIRKPTPLGILLKTLSCGITGILLNAEIVEGKEIDQLKQYFEQYGHTTATTLRVTAPYHGSGRYLVADAWFGQFKCAYALRKLGLFSIMNVKNNHKRFPKRLILDHLSKRDDRMHMSVQVENGFEVYASGHMDVQPMVLVHTTGTSLEGSKRDRVYRHFNRDLNQYQSTHYQLDQPDVHARYREAFSKIDILNKTAVGHGSLTRHIQTTKWAERYFYGLLSLTVTNAWKVYNMRKASRGERSVSIHFFLKQLARRCLNNPLGDARMLLRPGTSTEELQIVTQVRHGLLVTSQTGSNPKCVVCKSRGTSIKCICGAAVCQPRKFDCYLKHMLMEITQDEWKNARSAVLESRRG